MDSNNVYYMDYVDAIMIVDERGRIMYSVRYNPRFDKDCHDREYESIINKNFLEIYSIMNPNDSSIIKSMEEKKPIFLNEQAFVDYKGRLIKTQNLTIPIIKSGKVLGAIELSKDITKIEEQINYSKKFKPIINRDNASHKAIYTFDDIITVNQDMVHNKKIAQIIADNPSPVLIYGETGTGKELFVQSIHNYSSRKDKPFVAQNCAALPDNLFESILFGSLKGAFTGAVDRPGLFEEANGGTLFLDEINSMPLGLQAKLLRVLQDGKVRRVGDTKERKVDVRIITAMNIEPYKAIEQELIREDLFYRLSVVNIKLLPLRNRKEDIPVYIDYFINKYNYKMNKNIIGVSKEVEDLFLKYNWPGNVRELQHVIESSMNFISDGQIELIHLPVYLNEKMKKEEKVEGYNNIKDDFNLDLSLDEVIEKTERELIVKVLEKTGGNISKAAKMLKITRQRLHYKISKYNIKTGQTV